MLGQVAAVLGVHASHPDARPGLHELVSGGYTSRALYEFFTANSAALKPDWEPSDGLTTSQMPDEDWFRDSQEADSLEWLAASFEWKNTYGGVTASSGFLISPFREGVVARFEWGYSSDEMHPIVGELNRLFGIRGTEVVQYVDRQTVKEGSAVNGEVPSPRAVPRVAHLQRYFFMYRAIE